MKFYNLKVGEWFQYSHSVYIKIMHATASGESGKICNSLEFTKEGKFVDTVLFNGQTEITPVDIKFTIL